jgi:SAM-dependent methyltransferase
VPVVQADAQRLPFADASFDLACSAYGGVPFVSDSSAVMAEVARVLRPGGRWVFSTTHPFRWCFRDDPGPKGLVVESSYFDRRAYVEQDEYGQATYVEHHRMVGDRVREIVAAGLVLVDLVEPEWPDGHEAAWGQWSPLRGRLMPGTAIFVTVKP